MRKIFISAGHSTVAGKDCGASGNGFVEGVLAAELRSLIVKKLQNIHGISPVVDADDSVLSQTLNAFRILVSPDSIAVDIHFNASDNKDANGVEVLIPAEPSKFERDIAGNLSDVISDTLGLKNRGVKTEIESHHGKLGWMRLNCENVLIEVCFITNTHEIGRAHV